MKLKNEVSAFFKETLSSSLRYFCKKNNHTDIQEKTIFYISLLLLLNSVSVMNFSFLIHFCRACRRSGGFRTAKMSSFTGTSCRLYNYVTN